MRGQKLPGRPAAGADPAGADMEAHLALRAPPAHHQPRELGHGQGWGFKQEEAGPQATGEESLPRGRDNPQPWGEAR